MVCYDLAMEQKFSRRSLQLYTPIAGLTLTALGSIIPFLVLAIVIGRIGELLVELTTGVGIGFLILSLPYIGFYFVAGRDIPYSQIFGGAVVLLGSSLVGIVTIWLIRDPQAGIFYIYVLLLQFITVGLLSLPHPKKQKLARKK